MDTNGAAADGEPGASDIADSTGAVTVLEPLKKRWSGLIHLFADARTIVAR